MTSWGQCGFISFLVFLSSQWWDLGSVHSLLLGVLPRSLTDITPNPIWVGHAFFKERASGSGCDPHVWSARAPSLCSSPRLRCRPCPLPLFGNCFWHLPLEPFLEIPVCWLMDGGVSQPGMLHAAKRSCHLWGLFFSYWWWGMVVSSLLLKQK